MANVPCNGCTACCRDELIFLHPEDGDDPTRYETVQITNPITGRRAHALARRPDGACIYLGPAGCSIHGRAPVVCRNFDCRGLYLKFTSAERRRIARDGFATAEVFKAGRDRLHTLGKRPLT